MAEKKKYAGFSYLCEREKYLNSIGEYRCEKLLKGEEKCIKQCYECSQIYVEKK